ncbi:DUF4129 domain-containing protein [Microbacterium sp. No. 7]|uniref:DUF4129 domain-containing protein n=1 Tax=Microbacterium sp. No. 7 TaxID=1714373 RepID=UPI0006ED47BA|nr:DUF4129 domain-containing protein [Microbacterium sp. No. 7]ALJ21280.1 hypothetical protein AOA12_15785 [Microbacterium sp. No. 7]
MTAGPPLIPGGDEAREWAERELADPIYQAAEPSAFDRLAQAVFRFFADLLSGLNPGSLGPWLSTLVVGVVVVLLVVAILIWGLPRLTARSAGRAALFDDGDTLTAAELRRAAEAAAAGGDWGGATVLRTRAVARSLAERTIVEIEPGATVHRFAAAATAAFPGEHAALNAIADDFDDVRYLERPGTADAYARVAELDARLQAATPVLDEALA